MKCPKWLLEAMERGEGVYCKSWSGIGPIFMMNITGFNGIYADAFISSDGHTFSHAEPYVEEPHKFKPFDKVLVRDRNDVSWGIELFESKDAGSDYPFGGIRSNYKYCIPYEGNEHLLGTSDDPKETK